LQKAAFKAFGLNEGSANFQFYYSDEEGDVISISSQEDYEEALENSASLTLIIATSPILAK